MNVRGDAAASPLKYGIMSSESIGGSPASAARWSVGSTPASAAHVA